MGSRKVTKDLNDVLQSSICQNIEIKAQESNIFIWNLLINPTSDPFKDFQFKAVIQFPSEYPFRPPKIEFITPIYHPNIDEKGQICLPIIYSENWKPCVKAEQKLMSLIDSPLSFTPIRHEIASEYENERESFNQKALEFCKTHAFPFS